VAGEVICRLLLFASKSVETVEEKAVSQWEPLEWICAVKPDEILGVKELLRLNMLNESLRLVPSYWELKHR
jgi:hypothetical protein